MSTISRKANTMPVTCQKRTLAKADWALDWHHADPDKVLRDWINRLNQMTDADLANPKSKPRIRVKAGSRKVAP